MISFRAKLFIIFTTLLALTLGAMTWSVTRATQSAAQAYAQSELGVAERVFQKLMVETREQLTDRAALLTEDYGFREAIATNEEDTLVSVLANHGDRIGAQLVLLANEAGQVRLSSHDLGAAELLIAQKIASAGRAFSLIVTAESQAFQLVMVPVLAPNIIGWVGLGFAMDLTLLKNLKTIAKADVSLLTDTGLITTLSVAELPEDFEVSLSAMGSLFEHLNSQGWLSREMLLEEDNKGDLRIIISVSASQLKESYEVLQQRMFIVSLLALGLSILAVLTLARGISKPIALLVGAAKKMATGDYSQPVALQSTDEFGVLAETLNTMQSAIGEREKKIQFQASHDLVSGLPNTHQLSIKVEELFSQQEKFSGIQVCINNFGRLNDLYGISFVQKYVPLISARLTECLTAPHMIARIGVDEYVVLLSDVVGPAEQQISEVINAFSEPILQEDVALLFEPNIGIVDCPIQATNYEQLMRRLSIAVSKSRHASVPVHGYLEGEDETHLRKLQVTARLQEALKHNHFSLQYQPQLCLASNSIESLEVLIRWTDPIIGKVFPDEFIPLAEESGVISDITRWVVNKAREEYLANFNGAEPVTFGINLSAKDILNEEVVEQLLASYTSSKKLGFTLAFEVTETAIVADAERTYNNLKRFQSLGISLAMDDFGTGFSSLSQLKLMPVDKLKIDKSFVLNLSSDEEDQKIVKATIDMAHALGLAVVAEGVEDLAALTLLKRWHCDLIQGYYIARPMPMSDLLTWLKDFRGVAICTD